MIFLSSSMTQQFGLLQSAVCFHLGLHTRGWCSSRVWGRWGRGRGMFGIRNYWDSGGTECCWTSGYGSIEYCTNLWIQNWSEALSACDAIQGCHEITRGTKRCSQTSCGIRSWNLKENPLCECEEVWHEQVQTEPSCVAILCFSNQIYGGEPFTVLLINQFHVVV